jgi:hypothetical protein
MLANPVPRKPLVLASTAAIIPVLHRRVVFSLEPGSGILRNRDTGMDIAIGDPSEQLQREGTREKRYKRLQFNDSGITWLAKIT